MPKAGSYEWVTGWLIDALENEKFPHFRWFDRDKLIFSIPAPSALGDEIPGDWFAVYDAFNRKCDDMYGPSPSTGQAVNARLSKLLRSSRRGMLRGDLLYQDDSGRTLMVWQLFPATFRECKYCCGASNGPEKLARFSKLVLSPSSFPEPRCARRGASIDDDTDDDASSAWARGDPNPCPTKSRVVQQHDPRGEAVPGQLIIPTSSGGGDVSPIQAGPSWASQDQPPGTGSSTAVSSPEAPPSSSFSWNPRTEAPDVAASSTWTPWSHGTLAASSASPGPLGVSSQVSEESSLSSLGFGEQLWDPSFGSWMDLSVWNVEDIFGESRSSPEQTSGRYTVPPQARDVSQEAQPLLGIERSGDEQQVPGLSLPETQSVSSLSQALSSDDDPGQDLVSWAQGLTPLPLPPLDDEPGPSWWVPPVGPRTDVPGPTSGPLENLAGDPASVIVSGSEAGGRPVTPAPISSQPGRGSGSSATAQGFAGSVSQFSEWSAGYAQGPLSGHATSTRGHGPFEGSSGTSAFATGYVPVGGRLESSSRSSSLDSEQASTSTGISRSVSQRSRSRSPLETSTSTAGKHSSVRGVPKKFFKQPQQTLVPFVVETYAFGDHLHTVKREIGEALLCSSPTQQRIGHLCMTFVPELFRLPEMMVDDPEQNGLLAAILQELGVGFPVICTTSGIYSRNSTSVPAWCHGNPSERFHGVIRKFSTRIAQQIFSTSRYTEAMGKYPHPLCKEEPIHCGTIYFGSKPTSETVIDNVPLTIKIYLAFVKEIMDSGDTE
ncbi:RF10 [Retroperitoneal fibromatosis-associated herpesvirus]|uniref:RF10 n=1 Tax=Retroperitoneal fibromatosis-associated herpesvirus TaxID=111469 RepID=U5NIY5_9GAMA|nr:RF10 [Retroperitoneal fibromatosis-associated herpesvirus]AGY30741.1 RF10 [Retroperitoneal fibromatosis-associated herpesvirus]